METCKFCGKTMYLEERITLDRKSYIESYHCGYCGADYDKTIGQKKIVLREFWSNPNGRNYKQFLDVIEEFIDIANSISEDEKNELKDKIKKEQEVKAIKDTIENKASSKIQIAIQNDEKVKEAISALQVLGYNRKEIEKAFGKLPTIEMSTEELIRKGLVALGK